MTLEITSRLELMEAVNVHVPVYLRNVYNGLTEAQQQKLLDKFVCLTKKTPEDLAFLIYKDFMQ